MLEKFDLLYEAIMLSFDSDEELKVKGIVLESEDEEDEDDSKKDGEGKVTKKDGEDEEDEDEEDEDDEEYEEGADFWNEYITEEQLPQLDEAIKRKRVIRGGKVVWKVFTDRAGYKIYQGKEVRMNADEARKRSKAAKKVGKRSSTRRRRIVTLKKSLVKRRKLRV